MTNDFSKLANTTVSKEEFKSLFKDYKENGSKEAFDKLVKGNIALVLKIAHDYKFGSYEDLVSEGVLGLMKALEKYDPEKGEFSQYASAYINKYIKMSFNKGRAVKTKRYERLTDAEKAETNVISLNEKLKDGESAEIGDTLEDEHESHAETAEKEDLLAKMLEGIDKVLDARAQVIVRGLYGLNGEKQTLEVLANKLDLTKERVRQIGVESFAKLREYVEK